MKEVARCEQCHHAYWKRDSAKKCLLCTQGYEEINGAEWPRYYVRCHRCEKKIVRQVKARQKYTCQLCRYELEVKQKGLTPYWVYKLLCTREGCKNVAERNHRVKNAVCDECKIIYQRALVKEYQKTYYEKYL